jgi:hypothetical protein
VASRAIPGRTERTGTLGGGAQAVRLLLPLGWSLTAAGYLGPWIGHKTAALTLSGADMGELVKFLPSVLDGSLPVIRQLFYSPALAVPVSIALILGSRRLRYPWPVRVGALALAVFMSLQLLPPAWSPATLMTTEFRLQTVALGICWLLLAASWLAPVDCRGLAPVDCRGLAPVDCRGLGFTLPGWLSGSLSAIVSLLAMGLPVWQLLVVKPAIDQVYGRPPSVGWGCAVCLVGLAITASASIRLALRSGGRSVRR